MSSRKSTLVMTQSQWSVWAQQRIADGPKMEKLYKRQGELVQKVVGEQGCICNPIIALHQGEHGGPVATTPLVTHAMDCPNN